MSRRSPRFWHRFPDSNWARRLPGLRFAALMAAARSAPVGPRRTAASHGLACTRRHTGTAPAC